MDKLRLNPRVKQSWPVLATWLLPALFVALVGLLLAKGKSWTESQLLWWGVGFFCVQGIAFLLASLSPDSTWLFRLLVWFARRQGRWYRLDGFYTGGSTRVAGWICLAGAGVLGVLLLFS